MKSGKIYRVVAYSVSISLVALSLVFAFIMFQPVDVIKNWTLHTTESSYNVGSEVTIVSTLDKLMSVPGVSHRYIVCTTNGTEERFDINSAQANRPMGARSTEIKVTLPDKIANLPRICHINITIVYDIYGGIRNHIETADSNNFTVNPEVVAVTPAPIVVTPVTNSVDGGDVESVSGNSTATTSIDNSTKPSNNDSENSTRIPQTVQVLGIPICLPLTGICLMQ